MPVVHENRKSSTAEVRTLCVRFFGVVRLERTTFFFRERFRVPIMFRKWT